MIFLMYGRMGAKFVDLGKWEYPQGADAGQYWRAATPLKEAAEFWARKNREKGAKDVFDELYLSNPKDRLVVFSMGPNEG